MKSYLTIQTNWNTFASGIFPSEMPFHNLAVKNLLSY